MSVTIRGPEHGTGAIGERILRRLPDWFGIEASLRDYVRDMQDLPTFVASADHRDIGFLTLREHNPHAAEIHVMGVDPDWHRHGVGRALTAAAEAWLAGRSVEFLQVKTVGPSRDCPEYALTRRFYEAVGFRPLEELPTLWNEANPCLILVKRLPGAAPALHDHGRDCPPSDETFLREFESCTLPFEQWTHRAHIKAAWLYLTRHPLDDAIHHLRRGIRAYNAANDVHEGPESGYHETVTGAWARIIHAVIRNYDPSDSADAFCDANPYLLDRRLLRLFYSRDRIMNEEARTSFVEPDLGPLPRATVSDG